MGNSVREPIPPPSAQQGASAMTSAEDRAAPDRALVTVWLQPSVLWESFEREAAASRVGHRSGEVVTCSGVLLCVRAKIGMIRPNPTSQQHKKKS